MKPLVCVALLFLTSALAQEGGTEGGEAATILNPRGARPIEHGYKAEKCATEKEWPFCYDSDWGPKCPSGCRVQGLLDRADLQLLRKIEKIRKLLEENQGKYRSTDSVSKQTYEYLRDKLTTDSGNDNNYYDVAERLRQRIVELKIKIDRQLKVLNMLKESVREQVIDMQRLEVDIDIKLRSCKGSCQVYTEYKVDRESYVGLEKQVDQLASQSVQSVDTVSALRVMKSRPLKDLVVDSRFKSKDLGEPGAAEQRKTFFPEVKTVKFTLETEGSSPSSPATVSKVPECSVLSYQNPSSTHRTTGRTRTLERTRTMDRTTGTRNWCPVKPNYPLCSDDQWGGVCPSGCRVHGVLSSVEEELAERLRTVCERTHLYHQQAAAAMGQIKHIYNSKRRTIIATHMSELRYVEVAERLAKNLTSLRKRSARLSRKLVKLQNQARIQTEEMYRTEVDIDIKLRACKGSCRNTVNFLLDHDTYHTLQDRLVQDQDQDQDQDRRKASPVLDIPRIKLQPVDPGPAPSLVYRTIPLVRQELLTQFEDVEQNQVVLEHLEPDGINELPEGSDQWGESEDLE